jgi:hypothetical protein
VAEACLHCCGELLHTELLDPKVWLLACQLKRKQIKNHGHVSFTNRNRVEDCISDAASGCCDGPLRWSSAESCSLLDEFWLADARFCFDLSFEAEVFVDVGWTADGG